MSVDVDRYRAVLDMAVARVRCAVDPDMAAGVGTEVSDRARVPPRARIGDDVRMESCRLIGPNVLVGDGAPLGDGVRFEGVVGAALSALPGDGVQVGCRPVVGDRTAVSVEPGLSVVERCSLLDRPAWAAIPSLPRLAVVLRIWAVFGECEACNLLIIKDRVLPETNVVP